MIKYPARQLLGSLGRRRLGLMGLVLMFLCALGLVVSAPARASAARLEILTPTDGATVAGRNPETHLVLRLDQTQKAVQIRVGDSKNLLNPTVVESLKNHDYLHYRLPLAPGENMFTLIPSEVKIRLTYNRIRAEFSSKALGKGLYLFHKDENLPKSCHACHELQRTATIEPTGIKRQVGCTTCHGNITQQNDRQHSTTVNQQCLVCHQQSVRPLRIGFPIAKINDICLNCHTGKRAWQEKQYIHGPLKVGGCTLCHAPHGGEYRYQLWAEGGIDLCIECHSDKRNLVSTDKPLNYVHGIVKGGGCVACHDPHATNDPFMLEKPINELCVSCHTGLADVTRGHPVGGHPVSGPKERRRPGRELTCVSCHDPHGSRFRYLLIGDSRGGDVCIPCHR